MVLSAVRRHRTGGETWGQDDRRPMLLLELAAAMSTCANGLVALALPWLVLERTGNATDAGVVAAGTALPMLASALFAGTIVDLVGRRRTAVTSDLLSVVSVAAIPLADRALTFSIGWLTVLAIAGSAFDLAGITARKTMLPAAADAAGWRLERATGIHDSVKGVALMAGPGLGGVLVGVGGASAALGAAAAASLAAALFQLCLRLPGPTLSGAERPAEDLSFRAVRRGAVEGLLLVWRDRLLRVVGLLGSTLFMVYLPIAGVVLPYYFHAQGTPERFGLLNVAMTIGGIAGSLAYGFVGHRLPKRMTFIATMAGASGGLFAMAWLPSYSILLLLAVFIGLAYGPISPLMNLASHLRATDRTRGRVMGVMTSTAYVAGPVGYLAGGPLVEALGPRPAFVLLASVLCALVAGAAGLPALREFDFLTGPSPAGDRAGTTGPEQSRPAAWHDATIELPQLAHAWPAWQGGTIELPRLAMALGPGRHRWGE